MSREARRPGSRLGPYVLERALGRGGMATVFVGRHTATGATHAVKVLALGAGRAALRRERFDREARTLARLDHPGVIRIHGHDVEPDGTAWLSLAFVEGEDLAGALARGPLPWRRAAEVARDVAAALAHAHAADVVHRDVKPGNVLLEAGTGRVVLTDFGVARDDGEGRLTISQELLGTPTYMAPEQVTGDRARVGPASDVFALGVVLHECLVGRPPFEAESLPALTGAILSLDPPPPSSLRAGLPRALDDVVRAALAKDAARRPPAGALAAALDRILRDLPSGLSPGARPARGRGALAALAAALVLVAGAGAGLRAASARARVDTRARAAAADAAQARAAHAQAARVAWLAGAAPPDAAALGSARAALDAAPGAGAEAAAVVAEERAALAVALARAEVEAALAAGRPEAARAALGAAAGAPLLAARVALAAGDPTPARALADRPSPDSDDLILAARGALAAGDLDAAEAALGAARVRADGPATAGLRRTRSALLRARVLAAAARLDGKATGELLRRLADAEPAGAREAGAAALDLVAASDPARLPAVSKAVRAAAPGVVSVAAARELVAAALVAHDARRWSEFLDRALEARAIDPTLLLPPRVGTSLVVEAEALLRGKRAEDAVGAYSLAVRAGKPDGIPARMLEELEERSSFDGWLARHPDDWAARYLRGSARTLRAMRVSEREAPAVVAGALADLEAALAWAPGVPRPVRDRLEEARLEVKDRLDRGGTLSRCRAALAEGRGRPFEVTELGWSRATGDDQLPWALLNLEARKAYLDTDPTDEEGLEARRRERAAFDSLADLYADLRRWGELEALAAQLLARGHDPSLHVYYRARVAAGRGRPAEAIRLCDEVLEREPSNEAARRLRRQALGEQ
jgi:hypothetical protein